MDDQRTQTLLDWSRRLFGPAIASSVFEPLLADWQHESRRVAERSLFERLMVQSSGFSALMMTATRCAVSRLSSPPAPATALTASTAFVTGVLLGWPSVFTVELVRRGFLPAFTNAAALLVTATAAVPAAMLPTILILRRDVRTSAWHACGAVALGVGLYALIMTGGTMFYVRNLDRTAETMTLHSMEWQAGVRAGRSEYRARPGFPRLTPEQRTQRQPESTARTLQQFEKRRRELIDSLWSARTGQPITLALLMGMIGWVLGGNGRAGIKRAIGWWFLATTLVTTLDRILPAQFHDPAARQAVYWFSPLAAAVILAALSFDRHAQPGNAPSVQ